MTTIRKRQWTAPDGTVKQAWLVDYRDQAGKRRFKQFARKKDAEAWGVNAASEVQRGVHTADSTSITLSRAADLWLAHVKASDREPTTVAAYDQHVEAAHFLQAGEVALEGEGCVVHARILPASPRVSAACRCCRGATCLRAPPGRALPSRCARRPPVARSA